MKRIFLFILYLVLIGLLLSCRGHWQMESTETNRHAEEIGVEFHDWQQAWNSFAERLSYKIEFYPTLISPAATTTETNPAIGLTAAPTDSHSSTLPPSGSTGGVGFGSVKSIEFSCERIATDSSVAQTDSTVDFKSAQASDAHTEKASELRHDNGTVLIVSVVAAVAFIVLVLIVIRKFFKK